MKPTRIVNKDQIFNTLTKSAFSFKFVLFSKKFDTARNCSNKPKYKGIVLLPQRWIADKQIDPNTDKFTNASNVQRPSFSVESSKTN